MSRPVEPQRIAIVGSGIFGVTAALELGRRGHAVDLFDPGPLPHPLAASTDITKMIRMDYGSDEFYMALMEDAFAGWDRWNAEWGEGPVSPDGTPGPGGLSVPPGLLRG